MESPRVAARIHVLLARDAPIGLVLRRGPTRCVASILWDRQTDEFRLGQWLKGRIYERRSDLSPDGKYLIYFAMNGKWRSESGGSWTAISRAPWLKALAFFPKGDCWHGGGLFHDKKTYWLNEASGHKILRDTSSVRHDPKAKPAENYGGECPGVYYPRLIREGWTLVEHQSVRRFEEHVIFEKPVGRGWKLRKIAHAQIGSPPGKGCYWDEHELAGPEPGQSIACPDWEWADLDGDRLVWSAEGKLFAAKVRKEGLGPATELHDFNDMSFTPIEAPY
ncbi:hypothetical protein GC170_17165 [bacterium]|nr:hypothetical protein [bacterium]